MNHSVYFAIGNPMKKNAGVYCALHDTVWEAKKLITSLKLSLDIAWHNKRETKGNN